MKDIFTNILAAIYLYMEINIYGQASCRKRKKDTEKPWLQDRNNRRK